MKGSVNSETLGNTDLADYLVNCRHFRASG